MNICSLWGFVWIASAQVLAQKNEMFCLHGLGVCEKLLTVFELAGIKFTISSVIPKRKTVYACI